MTFVTYKTDPTQMTFIVGRRWRMFASKSPDRKRPGEFLFMHVGDEGWVKLHGLEDPIVPVLVEEVLGDLYAPEVTNYGWEDLARRPGDEKHDERPVMIQIRAGNDPADPARATMLLRMCFAYGFEIEESNGAGRVLALRITEDPRT